MHCMRTSTGVHCTCTVHMHQAALTGESLPVKMGEGDVAMMGSWVSPHLPASPRISPHLPAPTRISRCVSTGEIEAVVVATGAHTFFGEQ